MTTEKKGFQPLLALYGIFKFLVGFSLALVLMGGATVAAALYFAVKLTTTPPRPTFPNDQKIAKNLQSSQKSNQVKPTPSLPPNSSLANSSETLPPGGYRGVVIEAIGLILRDQPQEEAQRLGGIAYNETVIVLAESADKNWLKVRIPVTNLEGWVKAGNIEKIE